MALLDPDDLVISQNLWAELAEPLKKTPPQAVLETSISLVGFVLFCVFCRITPKHVKLVS